MKQVSMNVVSDKMFEAIMQKKDEDVWMSERSALTETYSFVVSQMAEDDSKEHQQDWLSVLLTLSDYKDTIDLFHMEARGE